MTIYWLSAVVPVVSVVTGEIVSVIMVWRPDDESDECASAMVDMPNN